MKTGARSRALQFAVAATLIGCKDEKKLEPADRHVEKPAAVTDTGSAIADTFVEPPDAFVAPSPSDGSAEPPHPRPKVTATVTATVKVKPPNLNKPYGAPPADGLLV